MYSIEADTEELYQPDLLFDVSDVFDVKLAAVTDTRPIFPNANAYVETLKIKVPHQEQRARNLSGGNQQKVVLARWLCRDLKVLILDNPTRGVDAGAKEEIYAAIEMFARRGIAIIVSSSEIGELLRLANRICILRNGRIVARVASAETSEEDILRRMAG